MSLLIDLADALVVELNGRGWQKGFQAVRDYVPEYSLSTDETDASLEELRVTVVPGAVEAVKATRGDYQKTVKVDIAVQQVARTAAQRDELMDLAEEITDYFLGIVTAAEDAVCKITDVQNSPAYAPEHLRQFNVFTSVVTLTCLVIR